MHAHKLQITIPEEPGREIAVRLPDDFPAGPAHPYQPTAAALNELLSFEATPEEEKVLEDFESFRKEHPFRLSSLAEEP